MFRIGGSLTAFDMATRAAQQGLASLVAAAESCSALARMAPARPSTLARLSCTTLACGPSEIYAPAHEV